MQIFFILFLFAFNLLQSYTLPLVDDEAYYWVWSKSLDFGYYDHPPMIALFIKIGYFLFSNELGVRFLSSLSLVLFYIIWLLLLKPKTVKENYLFIALFGSAGIFQLLGFIATPDTPLLLFGSFFIWRWKEFLERKDCSSSFLLALSMAATMYSKYHGALLIILAFLPFISVLIKNKWFYISILLALVLYSPHLYWQYNHEWITLEYHFFGRNKKELEGYPVGEWIAGLLLVANPLLIYYYANSLFNLRGDKDRWERSLRCIAIGGILFFGLFAFKRIIQPQWNLIIYLALVPLTYLTYKNRNLVWIYRLSFFYMGLLFLTRICLFFPQVLKETPMYKLKQFVLRAQEVSKGVAIFERYQKAALYDFYVKKPVSCLQVYVHRKSQYDVWDSEEKIQGKTITFFGLEPVSVHFILNEEGNKEFYKTITNFESYPKIKSIVSPSYLPVNKDTLQKIEVTWCNPYTKEVQIGAGTNQEIGILYVKKKTLEPVQFMPFSEMITLPAKDSMKSTVFITIPMLDSGTYKSFIVSKPYGISGKTISNELKIVVY